jgi:2-dehydropantoate 2-reductase
MRFLFFGAGAIGTYLGGSLALAGHTVAFTERPEPAETIRRQGLSIGGPEGERTVREVAVFTSPAEALSAGAYDVGVFALKSFDTEAALEPLVSFVDLPPIVCFQNGVDNEPTIARAIGPGRVIAGTVTSAVGKSGIGRVVLEKKRGVGVAAGHAASVHLVSALSEAGLDARLYHSASAMKWSKLMTNLLGNATSAILDLGVREVFADRRLFALELRAFRECLKVMRALEIEPLDLPGMSVRALGWAVRYLPRVVAQPLLLRVVGGGRGAKMPSFHVDLCGGSGKTEVGWLNGAVVRHGQARGVRTPVNRLLTETLEGLSEGRLSREAFRHQPAALLGLLGTW